MHALATAALLIFFAATASAEVIDSSQNGFTIRNVAQIGAARSGSKTWKLTDTVGGTQFEWTYTVGGYRPGGLAALAPAVDAVLAGQLQRLKRFVETGRPE